MHRWSISRGGAWRTHRRSSRLRKRRSEVVVELVDVDWLYWLLTPLRIAIIGAVDIRLLKVTLVNLLVSLLVFRTIAYSLELLLGFKKKFVLSFVSYPAGCHLSGWLLSGIWSWSK